MRIGIRNRLALLFFALVLIPMFGTSYLIEKGYLMPGENALLAIPVFFLFILMPFSKIMAHYLFNRDLKIINRYCTEVRKGNYNIHFDLKNETEDEDEYIILLRNLTWMTHSLSVKETQNRRRYYESRKDVKKMEKKASTDAMTGLSNRRYFDHISRQFQENSLIESGDLSLIYIDCDNFKQVNDTQGHHVGDQVLTILGETLNRACRENQDLTFRLGGDEFAVILPETDAEGAESIAQRIRKIYHANEVHGTTLSIGIASIHLDENTPSDVLEMLCRCADEQVYISKRSGKNSINTHVCTS